MANTKQQYGRTPIIDGMKKCNRCAITKPADEFRMQGSKITNPCKKCFVLLHIEEGRRRYLRNVEREKQRGREIRLALKLLVLEKYGSMCFCCGESDYHFLEIDHIGNNGNSHRREISGGNKNYAGYAFYCWLKKNNFPVGYRVACSNCNKARAMYGICPHEVAFPDVRSLVGGC